MGLTFRDLPHFVYRAYDADDALLYIGCTKNLKDRLAEHRRIAPWFSQMERVSLIGPFVGRDARGRALACERRLIAEHRPPFNADPAEKNRKTEETRRRTEDLWHAAGVFHPSSGCRICAGTRAEAA